MDDAQGDALRPPYDTISAALNLKSKRIPSRAGTTIHRYPVLSAKYSVMCKVDTGYHDTREIEHGLCAYTVDNPLSETRGLSLHTGAQTMLYLLQRTHSKGEWTILRSFGYSKLLSPERVHIKRNTKHVYYVK